MNVLPFHNDDVYGGLGQCRGLLKDAGDVLVLEVQIQDSIIGVLKSGVREVQIPIDDVVSLEVKKGWLGTDSPLGMTLVLQTSKVEPLSEIPGASQGRIELVIARKDVEAAKRFLELFHNPPGDAK